MLPGDGYQQYDGGPGNNVHGQQIPAGSRLNQYLSGGQSGQRLAMPLGTSFGLGTPINVNVNMLNRKWVTHVIFLQLLLIAAVRTTDEDGFDNDNEEEEQIVQGSDDREDQFVPSLFVAPKLGESSKPNFFDYFPVGSKIGQTWIKSLAKKDDVDSDIAKYNGEWSIGAPSKVSIEGDLGLIVKTKSSPLTLRTLIGINYNFFIITYYWGRRSTNRDVMDNTTGNNQCAAAFRI
uniref:Uncharacterized protein n=1 Tax=Caenorhabditis japonica TaxID=281687 RepID=A0A8R1E4B3_CAEJA